MRYFRLRFITEAGMEPSLIRFFSRSGSGFSHVDIVEPDGTFLGARSDGVKIRPANYTETSLERWYAIPFEDTVYHKMMDFAHAQLGKAYDFIDIFGLAGQNRDWHDPEKWICSELAAASMLAGGVLPLNVEPDLVYMITPEMLHLSPLLIGHCIYSKTGENIHVAPNFASAV